MAQSSFRLRAENNQRVAELQQNRLHVEAAYKERERQWHVKTTRLTLQTEKVSNSSLDLLKRLEETEAKLALVEGPQRTKLEHARSEVAAERTKNEALRTTAKVVKEATLKRETEAASELRAVTAERDTLKAQVANAALSLEPSSIENDRLRRELQSALATVTRLSPLQGQLKQSHARLAPANHRIRVLEQSIASATEELSYLRREAALTANELGLVSATARKEAQAESAATLAAVQLGLDQALADLKCSQVDSLALNDSLSRLTEELTLAKSDAAARTRELAITRTDIAILQQSRTVPSAPEALARIVALEAELVTARAALDAEKIELLSKVDNSLGQAEERERSLTAQLTRNQDELIIFRAARNLRIEELEEKLAAVDLEREEPIDLPPSCSISPEALQLQATAKLLQDQIDRLSSFSSLCSSQTPSHPSPHPAVAELEAYRKSSGAVIQILRKKVADLQAAVMETRP